MENRLFNNTESGRKWIFWVKQNDVILIGGFALLSIVGLTGRVYMKGYDKGMEDALYKEHGYTYRIVK